MSCAAGGSVMTLSDNGAVIQHVTSGDYAMATGGKYVASVAGDAETEIAGKQSTKVTGGTRCW